MGGHWLDESVLKGTVLIIGILEYFERTGYQYGVTSLLALRHNGMKDDMR